MLEIYDINDYLKDDKDLQKAIIEEFIKELSELGKTRDELKAENERLKEEIRKILKG